MPVRRLLENGIQRLQFSIACVCFSQSPELVETICALIICDAPVISIVQSLRRVGAFVDVSWPA